MLDYSSYFHFVQNSIPMINLISSVLIIILLISALVGAKTLPAGPYAALIVAVVVGITNVAVGQIFKPDSITANKMSEYLQRT